MRTVGIILLILGIIGSVTFGIQAISQSESFQILGLEIAFSHANWTPFIISMTILIIGIIMNSFSKKAR